MDKTNNYISRSKDNTKAITITMRETSDATLKIASSSEVAVVKENNRYRTTNERTLVVLRIISRFVVYVIPQK